MKKIIKLPSFAIILLCTATVILDGQSIGINNDKSPPDPSAMLDVKSTEKGVLIPRLTNDDMENIEDPAEGLLIFNIDENDLYFFRNEDWIQVGSNGGSNGQWTLSGGGIYNNTRVGVGTSSNYWGKFSVYNSQERTSTDIRNFYQGSETSTGVNVILSQNTSSQFGVSSSVSPNDNVLFPAVAYRATMSTVGGSIGKQLIGFEAYLPPSLVGTKYGLKSYATGMDSWAAFLEGRTFMSDRTYIGDIGPVEGTSWGALTIHNDAAISKFASLHLRNTASNTTYYGLYNTFTASTSSGANYGSQLYVTGGAVDKPIYGSFISLGAAIGNKTGLYVNAPGATNWAGYFNGRSYISEELLVGTTIGAGGYKLSVDGKIACEEVRVELNEAWPDYVFQANYNLRSLEDLENSIKEEGHLPGIPSAKEIEKEGLIIGEMQKQMMEKLEELTLYIIDLNKENVELKKRVDRLEQNKN